MDNQIQRRRATLSEFPDELLLEILSWLPTKNSIATSVLSKRWRFLWKEVKTLRYEFESKPRTIFRFTLFICRRSSVESLELRLNPNFTNSVIKPLVNLAVARSLRELKIEMVYNSFKLPKGLYRNKISQLETLVLKNLTLVDVPPDVSLICLKRLHLLSVEFSCDESVKTLLSICPRLQDLAVRRTSYTNVMIFTIDVPTLTSLSIDNSSGKSRPRGVHGFVINAPSLRCFSIRDSFSNCLRFGKFPELVKASISVVCDQPDNILGSLASAKYLSLCFVNSQNLNLPAATSFLFLDNLELYSCSSEWWNLLTRILNDAPRLRVLKIKLYQKHCVEHMDHATDPWNQLNSVPECLSSHLEIFEWKEYKGTEQESEAAKYILANASRLKNATFYFKSVEKHGMLKDLECVARGSKTCQLVLV